MGKEDVVLPVVVEAVLVRRIIVLIAKQHRLNVLIEIFLPFVESEVAVYRRQEFSNILIWRSPNMGTSSYLIVLQV